MLTLMEMRKGLSSRCIAPSADTKKLKGMCQLVMSRGKEVQTSKCCGVNNPPFSWILSLIIS